MKPSDFILNSDYLSIAQTGRQTITASIAAGTLTPGNYTEQNLDFTVRALAGAVDRIMIKKDSGEFQVGAYQRLEIYTSDTPYTRIVGFVSVFRTSATNMRLQLVLENVTPNTVTYPAMTFTVQVTSFRPPNVF